jgi:hypothetical protein
LGAVSSWIQGVSILVGPCDSVFVAGGLDEISTTAMSANFFDRFRTQVAQPEVIPAQARRVSYDSTFPSPSTIILVASILI